MAMNYCQRRWSRGMVSSSVNIALLGTCATDIEIDIYKEWGWALRVNRRRIEKPKATSRSIVLVKKSEWKAELLGIETHPVNCPHNYGRSVPWALIGMAINLRSVDNLHSTDWLLMIYLCAKIDICSKWILYELHWLEFMQSNEVFTYQILSSTTEVAKKHPDLCWMKHLRVCIFYLLVIDKALGRGFIKAAKCDTIFAVVRKQKHGCSVRGWSTSYRDHGTQEHTETDLDVLVQRSRFPCVHSRRLFFKLWRSCI